MTRTDYEHKSTDLVHRLIIQSTHTTLRHPSQRRVSISTLNLCSSGRSSQHRRLKQVGRLLFLSWHLPTGFLACLALDDHQSHHASRAQLTKWYVITRASSPNKCKYFGWLLKCGLKIKSNRRCLQCRTLAGNTEARKRCPPRVVSSRPKRPNASAFVRSSNVDEKQREKWAGDAAMRNRNMVSHSCRRAPRVRER